MPPGEVAWEAGAGSSPLSSLHAAQHPGGLPRWLSGKESACQAGDVGLIPGSVRSPGEGNSNTLQYSCLGNPMDRGAWWATIYEIARVEHD